MIQDLSSVNVIIRRQHEWLLDSLNAEDLFLHQKIDDFLDSYCNYHQLDAKTASELFMRFIQRFSKDLARFEETGNFSASADESDPISIDRLTYDVSLIISSLVTEHRFRIMRIIHNSVFKQGNSVVVGVGSGLELMLLGGTDNSIEAYDLQISPFVHSFFPTVSLNETPFTTHTKNRYDTIYAIELLEHIEKPFDLLQQFQRAMRSGGRLMVTTIKNVPQFDHIHNFIDANLFEKKVIDMGFNLLDRTLIPHEYLMSSLDANNIFYTFERL